MPAARSGQLGTAAVTCFKYGEVGGNCGSSYASPSVVAVSTLQQSRPQPAVYISVSCCSPHSGPREQRGLLEQARLSP